MNLILDSSSVQSGDNLDYEIVERKGVGHPDTLCDQISEKASMEYNSYCLENFGRYAHHWFDKVMLIGGEASLDFGSAELLKGFDVIFAGKCVWNVGKSVIPVERILSRAAADVLDKTLFEFNSAKELKTEIKISDYRGPGQKGERYQPSDASSLPQLNSIDKVSNDCNICVGFAPLSKLERTTLVLEKHLNSENHLKQSRNIGSDVKIIGYRNEAETKFIVNVPFIAQNTPSRSRYLELIDRLENELTAFCSLHMGMNVELVVNPEKQSGRSYLTRTGTVADTGDIGVTGRGNRANGLITPLRPMSIEASAGKNPLDHTGKLYNILAQSWAEQVYEHCGNHCYVTIGTSKERLLTEPDWIVVQLQDSHDHASFIREMTSNIGAKLDEIKESIINGKIDQW